VDIVTSESVKRVADEIRRDHGDPTVLVNNAGVMSGTPILDESEERLRLLFDINIVANFLLIKEFLPAMVKRNHGHIVQVASMASFVTGARNVSYAATKVAVLALHEGLAQELVHIYKANRVRTR
jgi:short-subunit dehydrogenase